MEEVIEIHTLPGYIKAVVGVLHKKVSPKEQQCLAALCYILESKENKTITKEVRLELANFSNYKLQVAINYINRLKKKGLITSDNKLHDYLNKTTLTLHYGKKDL